MEKDLIFFGESGLTSTSANFIANVAKEMYNTTEKSLNELVFYTTTIKLLGNNQEDLICQGVSSVNDIQTKLNEVAQCKSLIAWLREAIKAKERLIEEAKNGDYEYFGISVPEKPEKEKSISADDIIASFNIKTRNRYYYLEAFCATIGEYIHPNGVYSKERDKLQKVLHQPNEVTTSGNNTIIYRRTPSLTIDEVENTFMELQQKYRSYQAELNAIKYEIEDKVTKDVASKNIEYMKRWTDYKHAMEEVEATLATKRNEAVAVASNLKIIIPDALKEIYEKVQNVGKK